MRVNAKSFIVAIDPSPTAVGQLVVAGMLSKHRPNSFNPVAAKPGQAPPVPRPAPRNQPPQLFHNSYARASQRFLVKEWAFKIQHEGQLRIFSLRGKTKSTAALEAKSIWDTILADGWEVALGQHADQGRKGELFPKTDARSWRQRSGRATSALATLTPRERHVLALVSEGHVDKEIAAALRISVWTVHGHIKSIFVRLRTRTRTEAAVRYLAEQSATHPC
jgi:DNA-binding CsgD family transcriptional regulator